MREGGEEKGVIKGGVVFGGRGLGLEMNYCQEKKKREKSRGEGGGGKKISTICDPIDIMLGIEQIAVVHRGKSDLDER